ncbi:MAG: EamA family transporter, partial [Steroidobacteraceae bacterium]
LAVVPGVVLVIGGTPEVMRFGIVIGVLSAIVLALFATLNKRYIGTTNAVTVTGLEMASGALLLTLLAPLLSSDVLVTPSQRDLLLLLALAVGCTLLPFALGLAALAILLLGEQRELAWTFYAGVAIIFVVVFAWPWLTREKQATSAAVADPPGRDTTGSA